MYANICVSSCRRVWGKAFILMPVPNHFRGSTFRASGIGVEGLDTCCRSASVTVATLGATLRARVPLRFSSSPGHN